MAQLIDGKRISQEIKDELREEAGKLRERGLEACLAVVQVGEDPASSIYVRNKRRACEYVGIRSLLYTLEEAASQEDLLRLIRQLNNDPEVHGILVQLPLPPQIDEKAVLEAISPAKDVDGFHPVNVGKLCIGEKTYLPCTPAGIIELLKRSGISIAGKECVVIGRSNIVGKPMAMLLLRENGTVTITHSKTENLKAVARRADILVVAVGKPGFLTREYVKEGAAVIDVGIHRDAHNKVCGDVDFADVSPVAGAITPVPGGVGPMTISMLMRNCLEAVKATVVSK